MDDWRAVRPNPIALVSAERAGVRGGQNECTPGTVPLRGRASRFQLAEPSSLDKFARIRFEGTNYRIMTMGHTHNPGEYVFQNNKRFYNTGTWIPVIETSTAEVREDKTYIFLHLLRDNEGKLQPADNGLLQRWNDDAGRSDSLVLIERK